MQSMVEHLTCDNDMRIGIWDDRNIYRSQVAHNIRIFYLFRNVTMNVA